MADKTLVAKVLDDFGDDWHWVVLHDAVQVGPQQWRSGPIDTVCGLVLDEVGALVTLYDTGAPDEPNCPACLTGVPSGGLVNEIETFLRERLTVPAGGRDE